MLCGGPVVYWKRFLNIKEQYFDNFFKMCTDNFSAMVSYLLQQIACIARSFKLPRTREQVDSANCVPFYKIILTLATSRPLAGPPDFQSWQSDGPLPKHVTFQPRYCNHFTSVTF